MTRLSVNIDHVATLREARGGQEPDPVHGAAYCEVGGAAGITVHLRSDRRHIKERDLELLKKTVRTRLNIEMAATEEMVRVAAHIVPDLVTLVPERPNELTTEGGLDVALNLAHVERIVRAHAQAGVGVNLFIDPEMEQVRAAAKCGARGVELNTGRYADARGAENVARELAKLAESARAARKMSLAVAAGHGLNYQNVGPVSALPEVEELNIGHAVLARAVLSGLERAVADMVRAMNGQLG